MFGCFFLGLIRAISYRNRVDELHHIERIILMLEGEIRFKHSLIAEACENVSARCKDPFCKWLHILVDDLKSDDSDLLFGQMWTNSLEYLKQNSSLTRQDIEMLSAVGQAIGYLDIKAQESGLRLEKDNIHHQLVKSEKELTDKMKLSVILSTLGGIFIVIMLW